MMKSNIRQLLYAAFVLSLGAFVLPAQAHELRYIGDGYWIQVGAHVEPPYTHIWNGIDVFPAYVAKPDSTQPHGGLDCIVSINKRPQPVSSPSAFGPSCPDNPANPHGDIAVLEAAAIIVGYDAFNAPITKKIELEKKWHVVDYEIFTQYYQEMAFVLNKPTAYGFIVEGYIQKRKPDGITFYKGKHFVEKFVCEKGTQDTDFGTAFECMTNAPAATTATAVKLENHVFHDR